MYTTTLLACLALAIPFAWAEGGGFCYHEESCGPKSSEWPGVCQTGKRQTPINLPLMTVPLGATPMKFSAYKGSSFRMQNNGHSVQIDFDGKGPHAQTLAFPDPLSVYGPYSTMQGQRQYKFAAAHFHWGPNDVSPGSEHTIGGVYSAMEMHLVHYLASYPSLADAVASGDENALSVIGVLINANVAQTLGTGLFNILTNRPKDTGAGSLGPIARNIKSVEHADHDTSKWVTVNEPLDLSKLLFVAEKGGMYTYKGSLTTPGCNEQVNWYVLKNRATTSSQDLAAFRTVQDGHSKQLTDNHRPLQQTNGRKILLSGVIGY